MFSPIEGWVFGVHLLFWFAVAARIWMVPNHRATEEDDHPGTDKRVDSPRSGFVFFLVAVTMTAFYPLLVLWWFDPSWTGPTWADAPAWLAPVGLLICVAATGLVVWGYVVLPSFRVAARIDEQHRLMTSGPYAIVRHPVYVGIILLYLGSMLALPSIGFLLQAVLNAIAYRARAKAEEEVLVQAFDEYEAYMARTGGLVPKLR